VGADKDARDLRRGATITLLGHLLRAPHPILLALVTSTYGAEHYGYYVTAQSFAFVLTRICQRGLDRALVFWIPQFGPGQPVTGIRPVLKRAFALTIPVALVAAVWGAPALASHLASASAPQLAQAFESAAGPALSLALIALGMIPMAATDILIFTTIAQRRMESQVLVRDVLVPLSTVVFALAAYALGAQETGLGWAFVLSQTLGFIFAQRAHRKVYEDIELEANEGWTVPPDLARYARPLWFSEMAASAAKRTDVLILASMATPTLVGIFGVVNQFASVVKSMRGDLEAFVTAIVSDISSGGQDTQGTQQRVAAGFAYAASLVTLMQMPVVAAFFAFDAWVLPLFGQGFAAGGLAVKILGAAWLLAGLVGLSGQVVNGVGGSRATMVATVTALTVQTLLLVALIPLWGLEGAAAAVGLAGLGQALFQWWQMRKLTGTWAVSRRFYLTVAWMLACFATLGLAFAFLRPWGDATSRLGAYVAFLIPYGLGAVWAWRLRSGSTEHP